MTPFSFSFFLFLFDPKGTSVMIIGSDDGESDHSLLVSGTQASFDNQVIYFPAGKVKSPRAASATAIRGCGK